MDELVEKFAALPFEEQEGLIERLDKLLEGRRGEQAKALKEQLKRLKGGRGRAKAVKYRGPNGEEWAGVGRVPSWLATLEADGRSRDEFKA